MLEEVKKVLVPVDFSDNSQKVFESAANVAAKFGAELVCIFVVQSFEDYSGFFVPHMPVAQFHGGRHTQCSARRVGLVGDLVAGCRDQPQYFDAVMKVFGASLRQAHLACAARQQRHVQKPLKMGNVFGHHGR